MHRGVGRVRFVSRHEGILSACHAPQNLPTRIQNTGKGNGGAGEICRVKARFVLSSESALSAFALAPFSPEGIYLSPCSRTRDGPAFDATLHHGHTFGTKGLGEEAAKEQRTRTTDDDGMSHLSNAPHEM
jgi:hypothetical protein